MAHRTTTSPATAGAAIWWALAALLLPACLAAAPIALPYGEEMGSDRLAIELWGADLTIVIDPGATPRLNIRAADPEQTALARVDLEATVGSLAVRRVAGETEGIRLAIDVVLRPEQAVRVEGVDLDFSVRRLAAAEPAGAAADDSPGEPPRQEYPRYEFVVERARGELSGLAIAELTAIDSWLDLVDTRGRLAARLAGGRLSLTGHRGVVDLVGGGTEVVVENFRGQLEARPTGGSLSLEDGQGSVIVNATGADLAIESWRGQLRLAATDGGLDLRQIEGAELQLQGHHLIARGEALITPLAADLVESSLVVDGLAQAAKINARGGDLDLTGLATGAELDLGRDAEAVLRDIDGKLVVRAEESQVRIAGATRLDYQGRGGTLHAEGVATLDRLEAAEVDIDLDLRAGTGGKPSLTLRGACRVRVILPTPCMVRARVGDDAFASGVDILGCEKIYPDQRVRSRTLKQDFGGHRVTLLTADLDDRVDLEVEGK